MESTIVSVNKPSPVTLHQNHDIVFIKNVLIKRQISVLNLNMPQSMWDDTEVLTTND